MLGNSSPSVNISDDHVEDGVDVALAPGHPTVECCLNVLDVDHHRSLVVAIESGNFLPRPPAARSSRTLPPAVGEPVQQSKEDPRSHANRSPRSRQGMTSMLGSDVDERTRRLSAAIGRARSWAARATTKVPWFGPRVAIRLHRSGLGTTTIGWSELAELVEQHRPAVVSVDVFDSCIVRDLVGDAPIELAIRRRASAGAPVAGAKRRAVDRAHCRGAGSRPLPTGSQRRPGPGPDPRCRRLRHVPVGHRPRQRHPHRDPRARGDLRRG